jgi:hypothetical protein
MLPLLPAILVSCFLDRLPLHVRRVIAPAALERDDVVYDVPGAGAGLVAGRGARVLLDEPPPLLRIALDAVVVAGMVRSRVAAREGRVGHEADEASEKQRADPHGKDGSPAGAVLSAHPPAFGWHVDSAMKTASLTLVLLCACGHGQSADTDPIAVAGRKVQPAAVVSYLGPNADTGPIAQVWVTDQADYCAEVSTMDPCHANFFAGEGPLAGTYLHLTARGTTPGTYSVPTLGSAQLNAVTGTTSVSRMSATSGSITFSTLDAQGASGSYELTFDGGSASGRFRATGCSAFEPLYAKMRLPQFHPSLGTTTTGSGSCSISTTCTGRTRSVSCTSNGLPSWICQCTREDGSTSSCVVNAPSGAGCGAVPESCCVVGF